MYWQPLLFVLGAALGAASPYNRADRTALKARAGTGSAVSPSTTEIAADGLLPNSPPPAKLAPSSITAFQLIAFNEEFEVAFFSSLISNITNNVPGYELPEAPKESLIKVLNVILAQEQLHVASAVTTLQALNAFYPTPCQYKFPVKTLYGAIQLAQTFTGVVLGTLQDASELLAQNGDSAPVRTIASIIGEEAQQSGLYRVFLNLIPTEKPFLTTSIAPLAFSALQQYVVTGSCPFPLSNIDIPIFPPLTVVTGHGGKNVQPANQEICFSANLASSPAAASYVGGSGQGLYVTYLNGQTLPVSVPITGVSWSGSTISFQASFAYTQYLLDGLTIAALTTGNNYSLPDAISAGTLAGPGIIEVNVEEAIALLF